MPVTDSSLPVSSGVPFLNVFDPGFSFNSPGVIEAQAQSWYAEIPKGLLVLRHAEAEELLRDRRLNQNGKRFMEETCGVIAGPVYDWFIPMIVNLEGAEHLRLRRLVNKAFTARMIESMRPFIRAQAERLTDVIASAGECEFVKDFSNRLPLAVMCELLGVPVEDYGMFRTWSSDLGLVFSMALGGDIPARVETAVVGMCGYADSLIKRKAAAPADDLISTLVAARQESKVSTAELVNLIVTLVFAAHDNTQQQLGNAMAAFATHPEQWAALARHPELAGQAAEEVIRWCPSATSVHRFATEDFV